MQSNSSLVNGWCKLRLLLASIGSIPVFRKWSRLRGSPSPSPNVTCSRFCLKWPFRGFPCCRKIIGPGHHHSAYPRNVHCVSRGLARMRSPSLGSRLASHFDQHAFNGVWNYLIDHAWGAAHINSEAMRMAIDENALLCIRKLYTRSLMFLRGIGFRKCQSIEAGRPFLRTRWTTIRSWIPKLLHVALS